MNTHWKRINISVPISMIGNELLNDKCGGDGDDSDGSGSG